MSKNSPPHSFNKLRIPKFLFHNKKSFYEIENNNPNTRKFNKTCLTTPKTNYKKTFRTPYYQTTYFKDPYFLNDSNLQIQLQILREINKEDLDIESFASTSTNRTKYPVIIDNKNNKKENSDYFYKSVFKMKPIFRKFRPIVDNKFNMRYAENEEQYQALIEKEAKILKAQGKPVKKKNVSELIKFQMKDIKDRIRFMKGIMDYTYPGFVLTKIEVMEKQLNSEDTSSRFKNFLTPVSMRNLENKNRGIERKKYLYGSIGIVKSQNKLRLRKK